jgi:hypothetical protein
MFVALPARRAQDVAQPPTAWPLLPHLLMRRWLFIIAFPLALTACPAGGISVTDHAATTEGDDVALAVTVTSTFVDVQEYCLDIDWKDAAGHVLERHSQCDTDLEEGSRVTHAFKLFGRTCASYEIRSDVASTPIIADGKCPPR